MLKFNNEIKLMLTDKESMFLITLMNKVFEVDSFDEAIRYCIEQQMNSFEKELSEN